eukprot:765367-Hanusia_phi.AAC.2
MAGEQKGGGMLCSKRTCKRRKREEKRREGEGEKMFERSARWGSRMQGCRWSGGKTRAEDEEMDMISNEYTWSGRKKSDSV